LDGLNREVGRDTQGFDGSTVRATKTYDALGRVSQSSRPYFLSNGTPQLTTFVYDTLGRVVKATAPDGSVSQTAYHGLTVTATNALSQTRTVTKNSQGKIVSVTDALNQTITFEYDAVGNLLQTTDPFGNVVTATYDLRGRRIASSDPDLGGWTYSYNTLSQLVSQTDAKNQTTTVTYDLLDRVVQRVEADMTSGWVYDTAANGIGKLASSSITAGHGNGFARSFSYDALGRPSQVATTIDGNVYTMGATDQPILLDPGRDGRRRACHAADRGQRPRHQQWLRRDDGTAVVSQHGQPRGGAEPGLYLRQARQSAVAGRRRPRSGLRNCRTSGWLRA
jgi:YD repeat-containing protein